MCTLKPIIPNSQRQTTSHIKTHLRAMQRLYLIRQPRPKYPWYWYTS